MSNNEISILQKKVEDLKADLESVKRQQDLFKIFFHDSRDAIVIISKDGFVDCNQAALDLFLFESKEKFIKQHPGDLSPEFQPNGENSKVLSEQLINNVLNEEIPLFEWHHKKKDGTIFPSEVLLHAISVNNKKIIYSIIRDISERAEVINSLKESERKLKNIVEHSTNTFYSHTAEHIITYFSPQVEQLLGYTQQEALIKWTNLASDNPVNEKGYELTVKAIETGQMQEPYELELVHKSGKKVLVEVREAPVVDNGKTVGIVGALVDITERKNAENALKESEEKFRLLFEKSHDPILIIDNYNFIDCNDATVKILGFKSKKEIFEVHPSEISPEYQPDGKLSFDKAKEMMDIAYKTGYHRFEWLHADKSGKDLYVDVALTKIPYRSREVIFTVWRDITKQKEYEAKILEERKRLSILFEQAADGILVGINDGEIVEANESMSRLTGYSKKELIGQNIKMIFAPEILKDKPLRYDLVKKGDTVIKERNILRKDGSIIQVEMNTKILDDGRMQALFRDVTKRKETEEALKESEEKYRNIFHSSPIGVFHYDLNGVITDCNQNFVDIIGSSKERLKGLNMLNDLNDLEMVGALKKSIKEGEAYFEDWYTSVTAKKSTYVRVLFKSITNEKNQIISGIGLVEDITERKQAESALKESEEKYRSLVENINDAVYVIDKRYKVISLNLAARKSLGNGDYVGKSIFDFFPKHIADGYKKSLKEVFQTGNSVVRDSNMIIKGREIFINTSLSPLKNEFNEVVAVIGLTRDITERKKTEKLIKDNEEKIRNIYNSSSDIIMIISEDKKVININQAVEKNLGYSISEFIGKSPVEFIVETDVNEVDTRITNMLNKEKVPIKELIMISKSGEKIPFEVNSKLINYEGKKAILSVIRNIKERKELEQRIFDVMIETEENERQRLASDMHDEVGPLLSSLKMYIEMLDDKGNSEKQNFIHRKLKNLIKESITNVREVSNALSPNLLTQYGLVTAIKSFVDAQRELIHIRFRTNIEDERFGIKLETVYYRILKELINNTLKHSKADKVYINIENSDNKLILKYSDNGVGFSTEKLKYYKSKGQGLTNIETRVKTINGKYTIATEKNSGFKFELITTVK